MMFFTHKKRSAQWPTLLSNALLICGSGFQPRKKASNLHSRLEAAPTLDFQLGLTHYSQQRSALFPLTPVFCLHLKILAACSISSGQKTNRHFSSGEETDP